MANWTVDNIDLTRIYDLVDQIGEKYKARLTQIDAKGTGALIDSVRMDTAYGNGVLSVVMYVLDYWWYVENGRGPSRGSGWGTPIEDLKVWLKSKLQRGTFVPAPGKNLPVTEKEMTNVSWAIYKKITRSGYERLGDKAKPLQRTLEQNGTIFKEIAEEVARQLGADIESEFKTLNL